MHKALLVCIVILATSSANVFAGALAAFSGNTQPVLGSTEGYINFAVFDTSGGSLGDHYGTGLAGIDIQLAADGFSTTSSYLYLFQTVNTGADLSSSFVGVNPALVTGDGHLGGIGFTQTTPLQLFLGAAAAAPGNISPQVVGATQAEAAALLEVGLVSPSILTLTSSSLVAVFTSPFGTGDRSELWGYTSDQGPGVAIGSIEDNGLSANGFVPGAVPEPASGILTGFGLCTLLLISLVRRRKNSWKRERTL